MSYLRYLYLLVQWCPTHIVLCFYFPYLCLVYTMVPISLDFPFLITPNFGFDIRQRLFIQYWPFYQPCISMKYLTQSIRLFRIISYSVKMLLFSSARSHDYSDGMQCIGRCQCTQQKLQSICAVLAFDPQLICIKNFNAETIASLKLNVVSFFICCCQHYERKTVCFYKFLISDRQWGTEHQYLFSRFLGASILQLLLISRVYDYDMLTLSQ